MNPSHSAEFRREQETASGDFHTCPGAGQPGNSNSGKTADQNRIAIVSITLDTARAYIAWSSSEPASRSGAQYALGVTTEDGLLISVAIVGEPLSELFDDGSTIEVTRIVTNGIEKARTILLLAAWEEAQRRGYLRLVVRAEPGDPIASLSEAGFRLTHNDGDDGCADAHIKHWQISDRSLAESDPASWPASTNPDICSLGPYRSDSLRGERR